ncbi:Phosphatidylinositol-specific phospholipase C, Y domain protein, partial [Ancylostoma duodenale]
NFRSYLEVSGAYNSRASACAAHRKAVRFPRMTTVLRALPGGNRGVNPRQHVAYLSETTALRLTHTYAQEFAQTSRDYVVCVSPNVTRADSSNLNPQEFWNHGIQMVGINYQTPGLMVDLQ